MKVLVAVASRHGATGEIAERLGETLDQQLRQRGIDATVDVRSAGQVATVEGYQAVVLGSAVYMGRWLEPARQLGQTHAAQLARIPVWLFSSGPVGNPPKPDADPTDVYPIMQATQAREHQRLPGKLDKHQLGLAERATVRLVHAAEGDFRDWAAIDQWAASIADALARESSSRRQVPT